MHEELVLRVHSPFTLAGKYLRYWLSASNGKGHGVHSPFVFDFIVSVLNDRKHYYAYESVEALRKLLAKDQTVLEVEDFGAGSVTAATTKRTVSSITRNAAKPRKFGQLLFRVVNRYRPNTIVELGTSLGITSSYLALANPNATLVTLEGSKAVAAKALENFSRLQIGNASLVQGNFDNTLAKVLEALGHVNMAFVDGNHRKLPTLEYFRQLLPVMTSESVIIFDDIHWSAEMEEAWRQIVSDERVLLTIDLFFIGLVFFNPSFKVKQHFTIRF